MASEIKRYWIEPGGGVVGDVVMYSDHLAAVGEMDSKLAEAERQRALTAKDLSDTIRDLSTKLDALRAECRAWRGDERKIDAISRGHDVAEAIAATNEIIGGEP